MTSAPLPDPIRSVPLEKAYRLLNHGPTVLVSSAHAGRRNVMAAAWSVPVDFTPPKVAVVIDGATLTRELIEASGEFTLNIPCAAIAGLTQRVGTETGRDGDKFARHDIASHTPAVVGAPLIAGCVAWLECRVIRNPGNERDHDLFLAEVVAAHADARVFSDGRWHFEDADPALRTLHYVAGGRYYTIGEPLDVEA